MYINELRIFKVFNFINFDTCILERNYHHNQGNEHTHPLPLHFLVFLCNSPFLHCLLPPPGNLWFTFCNYRLLYISRLLCNWNHTVHILLLASFTQYHYFEIYHDVAYIDSLFFLLLSSISYGQITVYSFTCWWTFGLLPVWAVTNKAAWIFLY